MSIFTNITTLHAPSQQLITANPMVQRLYTKYALCNNSIWNPLFYSLTSLNDTCTPHYMHDSHNDSLSPTDNIHTNLPS